MVNGLKDFELIMAEALAAGQRAELARFGGAAELVNLASQIGGSRFAPEFIKLAIVASKENEEWADRLMDFAASCFVQIEIDIVLMDATDIIDQARPLRDNIDDMVFRRFCDLAADATTAPMTRAVAMDGAIRWVAEDRTRQLLLTALLVSIQWVDHLHFSTRLIRSIGVAYSYWGEPLLIGRLRDLSSNEEVGDEAAFELGMCLLRDALITNCQPSALTAFDGARYWFARSYGRGQHRPEAVLYDCALAALLAFARAEPRSSVESRLIPLRQALFEVNAWHGCDDCSWLGSRHAAAVNWSFLAVNLGRLARHLDEPSWWDPAKVIEQYVIGAYSAGRSILRLNGEGAVEVIVRPRLRESIAPQSGLVYALETWLQHNPHHLNVGEVRALLSEIDSDGTETVPRMSDSLGKAFMDLTQSRTFSDGSSHAVVVAILDLITVHTGNITGCEHSILEQCLSQVSSHSDYAANSNGRRLFDVVLLCTIRFLHLRLEMSRAHDRAMGYLFEQDSGGLPHESELQLDYHRFMLSALGAGEIEVADVGSGRADVRFTLGAERLVTEVKREMNDSSFEHLASEYGGQSTDYQNVSVRLGFLLVLDLTHVPSEGTPHISSLVTLTQLTRRGEMLPRHVVIVKVPGRRLVPSKL